MTRLQITSAAMGVLAVSFAVGRFSAPEHVRVETRTVEVQTKTQEQNDRVSEALDQAQHRERVVTQIVRPDGTRETTTRTISDRETKHEVTASRETASSETLAKETDTVKQVTRSSAKLDLGVLAGARLSVTGPWVYGVHVSRPVLGPVSLGLWGMSNGTAGVSVGLQF